MKKNYTKKQQQSALDYLSNEWKWACNGKVNYKPARDSGPLHHGKPFMAEPTFAFHEGKKLAGFWNAGKKVISINSTILFELPWSEVKKVLHHEMAHQYVSEIAGVTDQTSHGACFQMAAKIFNIPASANATFMWETDEREDGEVESIRSKIKKLMALAESDNENEANVAMQRATEMMTKYNMLEMNDEDREFDYVALGVPTNRRQSWQQTLASTLTNYFFVKGIWTFESDPRSGKSGWVFEVSGTPHNLDIAHYVHSFLCSEAERLWKRYRKENRHSFGRERQSFLHGVMKGFQNKMAEQHCAAEEKFENLEGYEIVSAGDIKLEDYYHNRYPNLRKGRSRYGCGGSGYGAGRSAGSSITISRGVSGGSSSRGRALTA